MKKIFHSIIATFFVLLSFHIQAVDYAIRDLGTLGADESLASQINQQNMILGSVKQGKEMYDFLWKEGQGLVHLPHPHYSDQPALLNNRAQVASIFWHITNYYWISNVCSKHIYLYDHRDTSLQDLAVPAGWKNQELAEWKKDSLYLWDEKDLSILSFNDREQLLISNSIKSNKATQFAVWEKGVFKEIDNHVISNAYRMNNQGMVLGRKWMNKDGVSTPMLVLYHRNRTDGAIVEIMKDINILTREINDKGQVIICQGQKNNLPKGFLWDPEKGLTELEDFAPLAINNRNQIVGFKITGLQNKKKEPLLWDSGEIIPLASFIGLENPASVWNEVTSLDGINDNGYVIGQGMFDDKKHAFVLIPVGSQ